MSEMESFSMESMVRGYHVYKDVWEASVGQSGRSSTLFTSLFAAAMLKAGTILERGPSGFGSTETAGMKY